MVSKKAELGKWSEEQHPALGRDDIFTPPRCDKADLYYLGPASTEHQAVDLHPNHWNQCKI